jgi:membrane-bound lytic murein transglycosylase F
MLNNYRFSVLYIMIAMAWTVLLSGCDSSKRLYDIHKRGELVVLTRNAPTTYYEDRDGLAGLEYEMASAFAEHLGVKARFQVLDSVAEILDAMRKGEGDLAAAGLTRTKGRARSFSFGPVYQTVEQQVVCRRGTEVPKDVEGLVDLHLTVIEESSYVERLKALKSEHPDLSWTTTRELDTEQLLEKVWQRTLQCTVADSNIVAINRRYFPELVVAFTLTEPQTLAWVIPSNSRYLKSNLKSWFHQFRNSGELDTLLERNYGFIDLFDYVDTRIFKRRIHTLLPRYRPLFESAGRHQDLPWTLLAAQAYQESQWDPQATSPTGVRGIMMLTHKTALSLGVEDRIDPEQSIIAGARYMAALRRLLPDEITEPDRTWITLAAYNVGMAHIEDAQALSRRLDKDPYHWNDLKTILPYLAQKRYYQTLKHGYARGREPVIYVQRIRDFHDILERSVDTGELGL